MKKTLIAICLTLISILSGCGIGGGPGVRLGCCATSTPGTRFTGQEVGNHHYGGSFFETNGIAYTCRGGHIDIAHLRIGADNTRHVYQKAYTAIVNSEKNFSFGLPADKSDHFITLTYPENWNSLNNNEKEKIAHQVSLNLAPYLIFNATTWHEMLTYVGYKTMFIFPEDASAFSWEDIYSNLSGCILATRAIEDTEHSYNEAMTILLNKEMEMLGIQSSKFSRNASAKMRNDWFTGNICVTMIKRNFDIGIDDGFVSPSIVPNLDACLNTTPHSYPAPNLDLLIETGFSIVHEIEPHEFEKSKLLKIIYPNGNGKTIKPIDHFPLIIDELEKQSLDKGWYIR